MKLSNTRTILKAQGYSARVYEALRRVEPEDFGPGGEKLYDPGKVGRMLEQLTAECWHTQRHYYPRPEPEFTGERWRPDHSGPWTIADMAEFNRRHPFRLNYLKGLLGLLRENQAQVSHCRGAK